TPVAGAREAAASHRDHRRPRRVSLRDDRGLPPRRRLRGREYTPGVRRRSPVRTRVVRGLAAVAMSSTLFAATPAAAADDVLVEFHFKPVPRAQIAIWVADADGEVVQDVFVTQAT